MSKNIIIPISNEHPIVLTGSVPTADKADVDFYKQYYCDFL